MKIMSGEGSRVSGRAGHLVVAAILIAAGGLGLIAGFLEYLASPIGPSPPSVSLWDLFMEAGSRRTLLSGVFVVLAPGVLTLAAGIWALTRAVSDKPIRDVAAVALGAGVFWVLFTVGWGAAYNASPETTLEIGFWLLALAGVAEVAAGAAGLIRPKGSART